MKRKTLITILFATLALYGCGDDENGTGGSGGSAGTGGSGGGTGGTGGGTGGTGGGTGGTGGTGGIQGEVVYEQNFESLDQASTTALGDAPPAGAGFIVFGNVFSGTDGSYIRGYGPNPAPNNPAAPAFSLIASGEGGTPQGAQQLVIISDYQNRTDQDAGNPVEANTFQELTITSADLGTLTFSFDAKLGNIAGSSTALAFIKTFDPADPGTLTNFPTLDMTAISGDWMRYMVQLVIDAGLVGQTLQFGFSATATNDEASGVFYDNIQVVLVE